MSTDARWRTTAIASIVVFVALLGLFYSTGSGMAYIWYNFETYTHGFLILPITLWLVWQKREHLAAFTPQPTPGFLLLTIAGLFVWVLAKLTGVLVIEQFAFVGVVIAAVAGILGWQVSKFLAFPLLFLFFAVPMGEDLVPPMMEFTATFTVEALKLTGIPVYRDGLWFSLPSGNWSVVEACSGVRYLIASVTLGVMYAYITYHTLWKRLLFILMSAIVPILANGLRAYMIVMIGHLSEMEYATGVDHLIYGWFFFGIVMFILFWIGSFWQEEQAPPEFVAPPRVMSSASVGNRVQLIAVITLLLASLTVYGVKLAEDVQVEMAQAFELPASADGWRQDAMPARWSAEHQPTPHSDAARYSGALGEVQLFTVLFPHQRQGNEAINNENKISEHISRTVNLGASEVVIGSDRLPVNRQRVILVVDGRREEHLVWQWYRVAGRSLVNRYEGKAWEALARIWPGRADGAWVAITTRLTGSQNDAADKRLESFAKAIAPAVDDAIDNALGVN